MKIDAATLISLFDSVMSADYTRVRRAGSAIAKQFAEQGDIESAKTLQGILRKRGVPLQASGYVEALPRDNSSRLPLVEEAQWPTTPLFASDEIGQTINAFLEDAQNSALFAQKGISTRLGLMIYGPPGTGKTLLAGNIASQLKRAFYVARLDSVITSRLGETSKNIRAIFDFIPTRNAVLFLDELDAIAKLRDDKYELGELKRVVNTVLQGIDSLSDDVVVIGATNHPHLLDPAIWRRFPYKIELNVPDAGVREAMWAHFLDRQEKIDKGDLEILGKVSAGLSGADIENIALAVRRRSVLTNQPTELAYIILAISGSRSGNLRMSQSSELSTEQKKNLAILLSTVNTPRNDIARIIGISRQMVHRYLKGEDRV